MLILTTFRAIIVKVCKASTVSYGTDFFIESINEGEFQLLAGNCQSRLYQWPLFLYFPAIDYIQFLVQQKKKQEDELDSLRKEVMALKIMKA